MDFINIETLFVNNDKRTITELAKVYCSKNLIKEKIKKVGQGFLDTKTLLQGKRVLIKPNWVIHDQKDEDSLCLRTSDNFVLALVELLLESKPGSIIIGDAPVQGCNWDKMISKEFIKTINELSVHHSIPIEIKDFRRVTFDPSQNNPELERHPLSDYTIFDMGKDSYLEPISSNKNIFRVTSYDPDRLAESHTLGKHKYCVTKELFDADVVISLPKIKTHQKTGITGALKNIVGFNGDKDYLPHHRVGGTDIGGDCYPGKNILRRISEFALDNANRNQGKKIYWFWFWSALIFWKLSQPKNVHQMAAGWYGNDTTWRMVMDLNKIVIFGNKDGTISKEPQRILYSLCDGIVGGQGDGPLNPNPLPLGVICFTNNSAMADICMAALMRFDIQKIPLLKSASQNILKNNIAITLNGKSAYLPDLAQISIETIMPPGWVDYQSKI